MLRDAVTARITDVSATLRNGRAASALTRRVSIGPPDEEMKSDIYSRTIYPLRTKTARHPLIGVPSGLKGCHATERRGKEKKLLNQTLLLQILVQQFCSHALPCRRGTGGRGTACRGTSRCHLPSKVFCGMDGGRGGKEGAFFAKKAPSFPPLKTAYASSSGSMRGAGTSRSPGRGASSSALSPT